MKTIPQLERQRDSILRDLHKIQDKDTQDKKDRAQIKKHCRELGVIKLCIRYLETSPAPDFVKSELDRIGREIEILSDRFSIWVGQPENRKIEPKKAKGVYDNAVGMKGLRARLSTMKYLNQ